MKCGKRFPPSHRKSQMAESQINLWAPSLKDLTFQLLHQDLELDALMLDNDSPCLNLENTKIR